MSEATHKVEAENNESSEVEVIFTGTSDDCDDFIANNYPHSAWGRLFSNPTKSEI